MINFIKVNILLDNVKISFRNELRFIFRTTRNSKKMYNIPNNMEELLRKYCEVEKLMNSLKDERYFMDI